MRLTSMLVLLLTAVCHLGASFNPPNRPNIILILTDDQDVELGSLKVMKKLQRLLTNEGAEFANAFTTTPMCCPSRSSILTGLYTHNHNVYTNHDNCSSYEWRQRYETRVFGYALQQHGYRTAYLGKYLNEYNGTYVPQGWDDWVGLLFNSKYYNYTLNVNGRLQSHGGSYAKDYLPDLIANESVRLLQKQRLFYSNQPLLMVMSFPSPHGREDAAPQFQHLFAEPEFQTHRTPGWNHAPNKDKEWLLRYTPKMTPIKKYFTDILQQKRLQTLMSVDDAVEKLVGTLDRLMMLDNTYIIYTSDHGYHAGQFGLIKGKSLPYDFDVKIPFIVRGPGVGRGTRVHNIVLNVDLAPTILGLAGLPQRNDMDGRPIGKLLTLSQHMRGSSYRNGTLDIRRAKAWRESFLIERGKLTSRIVRLRDKLEASKNRILSKRARLEEECQSKALRYPCEAGQKWFCWQRKDGTGLRKLKCRHAVLQLKYGGRPITTHGGRKLCPCTPKLNRDFYLQLSKGRRSAASLLPERRGRPDAAGFALWNDPVLRNMSTANFSRHCRFVATQQRILCSPYHNLSAWARDSRYVNQVLALLRKYVDAFADLKRVLRRSRPQKIQLCECPDSPALFHHLRMARRRERRLRRTRRRKNRKKKKKRLRFCNERNMNCFVHKRDHWRTPPFWRYRPICFCGNSNNNTYWCVRTINESHNFLYCEYVTGFISFFNLTADPYQLENKAHQLPFAQRQEMHLTLERLRRCRGPRQCWVRSVSERPNLRHRRRHRRKMAAMRWRFLLRRSHRL